MAELIKTVCPWIVAGMWSVIAVHVGMCLRLICVLRYRKTSRFPLTGDRAMIVLCLRGDDPYLEQTLRAALSLDYPDYLLKIVVDHKRDPAMATVRRVLAGDMPHYVTVEVLGQRHTSCSLKCSALLQALRSTPVGVKYIALLDADVVPHATWLADLVRPLSDPDVAVTTGNRWYMPRSTAYSALVRCMWNAGAVSHMFSTGIAWGGSMALKSSLVHEAKLLDKLERTLCEDTVIGESAKHIGKRVEFVPEAIMINSENCRLSKLFAWLSRQLLLIRLYHSCWRAIFSLGLVSFAAFLVVFGSLVTAALVRAWGPFMMLGLSSIAAIVILGAEVAVVDLAVRRIATRRGNAAAGWSPLASVCGVCAFLTVPLVYALALLRARSQKEVSWRGIEYRIDGPFDVSMKAYRPFRAAGHPRPSAPLHAAVTAIPMRLATAVPVMHESIY